MNDLFPLVMRRTTFSDSDLIARNKSAHTAVAMIFLTCLALPIPFHKWWGYSESDPRPGAVALVFSIIAPTLFLLVRQAVAGQTLWDFFKYCEIKDKFSIKAQVAVYVVWLIMVLVYAAYAIHWSNKNLA